MPGEAETAVVPREEDVPPTALTVVPPRDIPMFPSKDELSLILTLAATAVKAGAGFVPSNVTTAHQAAGIMLAGRELGVRPMTSLRHIFAVNGRFELETRLMMGVCKAKDPSIDFEVTEYTKERVAIVLHRAGKTYAEMDYTLQNAKDSGQYNENAEKKNGPWYRFTRDMLFAAAGKRVCRIYCPELINAIDGSLRQTEEFVYGEASPVRVIEPEELEAEKNAVIPPDAAFNAGDDPNAELPPEVQQAAGEVEPDRDAITAEVLAFVKEGRETLSDKDLSVWAQAIRKDFPTAFDSKGMAVFPTMEIEELVKLRNRMKRDLHGEEPPA